jgi:hypothetical protein
VNLRKLKRVAAGLDAMILRPFYPVSKLYRAVDDASGLQAAFMPVIHGVRSFEGLKARAVPKSVGGCTVLVATLGDIIASKAAAGRERDLAILPVLRQTQAALERSGASRPVPARPRSRQGPPIMTARRGKKPSGGSAATRRRALAVLAAESDRQLADLIRRRLALPLEQRMNFLRRRLPGGGSCL